MSKSFTKGYALGQQDGGNGENKLPLRSFTRLFTNPASYLPGAQNRDAEWVKGYRTGFEDQVRTVNVRSCPEETAMSIESASSGMHNMDILPENSGSSGKQSLDYQISVAESLLSLMSNAANVIDATGEQFNHLVQAHEDWVSDFMEIFVEEHLRPRLQQLGEVYMALSSEDVSEIRSIINSLMSLKHGASGGKHATQMFTSVTLGLVDGLSQIGGAVGCGDQVNSYATQIAVSQSLKRVLTALLEHLNTLGATLNQRVNEHDELMSEDFNKFYRKHAEPRLEQLSKLYRAVENEDIPMLEDIICRLIDAENR
ncbi:MAG: hypothetical protein NTV00_06645 [Methylococcales bacterium]|nr:hypothetical protein [Methylococcales bacterium]